MTTLKIFKIAFLAAGFFFLLFGFIDLKSKRWGRYVCYSMIALGIIFLYIPTLGPISKGENCLKKIMEIDGLQVDSIVLQPTKRNNYLDVSIFDKDSVVADKNIIQTFCKSLHNATDLGWAYKNRNDGAVRHTRKCCRIEIHFADQTSISFGVVKVEDATFISVNSNGEFGWHFANLLANEFGNLLTNSNQE